MRERENERRPAYGIIQSNVSSGSILVFLGAVKPTFATIHAVLLSFDQSPANKSAMHGQCLPRSELIHSHLAEFHLYTAFVRDDDESNSQFLVDQTFDAFYK